MTTVCYFSATGGELSLVSEAVRHLEDQGYSLRVFARSKDQLRTSEQIEAFAKSAARSDVIVLNFHGGTGSFAAWDSLVEALEQRQAMGENLPWIHIQSLMGDDDAALAAQQWASGVDDGTWRGLIMLMDAGGPVNLMTALKVMVDRAQGRNEPVPSPRPEPLQGIAHHRLGVFTTLADYEPHLQPGRPLVALLYPRTYWLQGNTAHIDALVDALEERGANTLPIFCLRLPDARRGSGGLHEVLDTFCQRDGTSLVDAVIDLNSMSASMAGEQTANAFPDLGVVVLHGLVSSSPYAAWSSSVQGLNAMDVSIQAAQPELDGEVIATVVATREIDEVDDYTGGTVPKIKPIPGRCEAMAEVAFRWAQLRRLPNVDKKVAVIFHHHPPRNDRIGCASGLDTFESVRRLLVRLEAEGYRVDEQYADGDELAARMLSGLTCDKRWLLPEEVHARAQAHADQARSRAWNAMLPERNREDMERNWGPAPGSLFVHEGELSFAGHRNGNIFLTIQPPRGSFEAVTDSMLHDIVLPPPHHYLAHYRWIRDIFKADAVIHVGTHGSLEWLPGKALGMSEECYPELALASLPNIYPYIVNNPGEGIQAKRRSACVIVDHLTPPMRNAELYDETADVDRALREYIASSTQGAQSAARAAEELWKAVVAAGLDTDLELTEQSALAEPAKLAEAVQHYLLDLADAQIFDGLHILGSLIDDRETSKSEDSDGQVFTERLAEFLAHLTRLPNGAVPSLRESVLHAWGTSLDQARENLSTVVGSQGLNGADTIMAAHRRCVEMQRDLVVSFSSDAKEPASDVAKRICLQHFGQIVPEVVEILAWVAETLLPQLEQSGDELDSVITALSAGFVAPGPSGAPTRGRADVLPTGRNFYSVDPALMPTRSAWSEGVALGDQLLQRYAQENPDTRWPQNVGIVMWGVSNLRTGGADVAEALYLMGLRPKWRANGTVMGVEVIGLEELGRPRIDVTPRISGLFRDALPNLVELLDHAVGIVAALNEPEERNLVRAHVEVDYAELIARGIDPDEARRKARLRVFGCPPGTYGAGVAELIETKQWQDAADLGEAYIAYSSYSYGEGIYGDFDVERFRANLARMDTTVKNEDTREYDMLSCTDFYNYYGGLIAAATTVRGEAPLSLVGDSSDPGRVRTRTTTEEARLVLRSRILNPTWIEGLQRHGYKGAGDLSKVLDILIGWDATANAIDDGLWDRVARRYALDPAMQEWFRKVNPYALQNIVDKLLDAAQRELWSADPQVRDELEDLYVEIEGTIEDTIDDSPTGGEVDTGQQVLTETIDLSAWGVVAIGDRR